MIRLIDKKDCCGCSACVQKCPKKCIFLKEDEEGFLYPAVEINKCIDCGLCEMVCPVLNQAEERIPLDVFAALNTDDRIRMSSSSGGVFTMLAEHTIKNGGVVFGVKWNEYFEAVHDYTDTVDGIACFRGSKYVQSLVGNTFKQVRDFLLQGRKVLYSGTPCQISALKLYLSKDYKNLLTVDVVCHGVPSPKIWREYLESLKLENIGFISHKDKITGWKGYSFSIKSIDGKLLYTEKASYNIYMKAFVKNLTLRPSCFFCPSKAGKSKSDITLADYWGVECLMPKMYDNKGTSLVCANTQKGVETIENLNLILKRADYNQSVSYNSCIVKSTYQPIERDKFWSDYSEIGVKALPPVKKESLLKKILKRILR